MARFALLVLTCAVIAAGCASGETETRAYTLRNQSERDIVAAKLNQANAKADVASMAMESRGGDQYLVAATPTVHRAIERLVEDARKKQAGAGTD